MGHDLCEQLVVQQVIQEGNSLDGTAALVRALRERALEREATTLEYVNADEVQHARLGNRWASYLVGGDSLRLDEVVDRMARRIGRPVPVPRDDTMRELAGFACAPTPPNDGSTHSPVLTSKAPASPT
jgi:uncharacterized ferritin-like protein (DUF455 family)